MALFKPLKRTKNTILSTPIVEGQWLCATDSEGEMWLDISPSKRIQIALKIDSIATKAMLIEELDLSVKTLNPPIANTYYKFGELTALTLQNIQDSTLPVVIWFSSGSIKTTLTIPTSTPFSGSIPDADKCYELSIVNKHVTCIEFNAPDDDIPTK